NGETIAGGNADLTVHERLLVAGSTDDAWVEHGLILRAAGITVEKFAVIEGVVLLEGQDQALGADDVMPEARVEAELPLILAVADPALEA
ncbi:MAG: hypothetical protein PHC53_04445, partial [Patescibacteria group bacterium]|nr:hypothetical protein [Patescibacteria group bacterium]